MIDMQAPEPLNEQSPFHKGERAVQQRVGVFEKLEPRGHMFIRTFMPDQHRDFFAQLPFVIAGSLDAQGQPWASILVGQPGFMSSPDPHHLIIKARAPASDPLHQALSHGASIGLLGIEPHTRRRNRMNGTVQAVSDEGFTLQVTQSFGNCPKYIQAREPGFVSDPSERTARATHRGDRLDAAMAGLIASSDTLFIASAYMGEDALARQRGVDVSHRGGKPGFVRVDDDRSLTMPDFIGNFFFNTIGNLVVNPRAGLLFIDYLTGDLLYLAVEAEIIWDGAEVAAFAGAERLLRFHVKQALRVEAALPLRWSEAAFSPALDRMGAWPAQAAPA